MPNLISFQLEEVVRPLWAEYLTAREKKTDGDEEEEKPHKEDKPFIDDEDL